jgi:Tol biopolymer transport system component
VGGGATRRLTSPGDRDGAQSFSPDGSPDRLRIRPLGTQQIYVMPAAGGEAQRISAGQGRYGTPVWSPRGDRIAFTKQNAGRFHIGVMRTDGTERAAVDRVLPGRGADLGAQRAGADVHPRNPGRGAGAQRRCIPWT